MTEFGWQFRIDTEAVLTTVTAKSGAENGDKAPSAKVEDWFNRLYDPATFPPVWSRKGSDDFFWYVYEAAPVDPTS